MSKEVSKVEKTVLRGLLDLGKKAKAEEIAKKTNLKTRKFFPPLSHYKSKTWLKPQDPS